MADVAYIVRLIQIIKERVKGIGTPEERLINAFKYVNTLTYLKDEQIKLKVATVGVLLSYDKSSHDFNRLNFEIGLMDYWGEKLNSINNNVTIPKKLIPNIPKNFKPIGIVKLYYKTKQEY